MGVVGNYGAEEKTLSGKDNLQGEKTKHRDQLLNDLSLEYRFEDLASSTNNFSQCNCIGRGAYGNVYKGTLKDGTRVAVKFLHSPKEAGFEEEVRILSKFRHPNLVILMGFARNGPQRILVYELLDGGDAVSWLQRAPERPFLWAHRLSVVLDAASGLSHLHNSHPKVFHRDIKSANILLDKNGSAKWGDFGLACLSTTPVFQVAQAAGTIGYADPYYIRSAVVTEWTEVYSFGWVIVELLTARPPAVLDPKGKVQYLHFYLRDATNNFCSKKLDAIVDPSAGFPEIIKNKLMSLAICCIQDDHLSRPDFCHVVCELRKIYEEGKRLSPVIHPFCDSAMENTERPSVLPHAPATTETRPTTSDRNSDSQRTDFFISGDLPLCCTSHISTSQPSKIGRESLNACTYDIQWAPNESCSDSSNQAATPGEEQVPPLREKQCAARECTSLSAQYLEWQPKLEPCCTLQASMIQQFKNRHPPLEIQKNQSTYQPTCSRFGEHHQKSTNGFLGFLSSDEISPQQVIGQCPPKPKQRSSSRQNRTHNLLSHANGEAVLQSAVWLDSPFPARPQSNENSTHSPSPLIQPNFDICALREFTLLPPLAIQPAAFSSYTASSGHEQKSQSASNDQNTAPGSPPIISNIQYATGERSPPVQQTLNFHHELLPPLPRPLSPIQKHRAPGTNNLHLSLLHNTPNLGWPVEPPTSVDVVREPLSKSVSCFQQSKHKVSCGKELSPEEDLDPRMNFLRTDCSTALSRGEYTHLLEGATADASSSVCYRGSGENSLNQFPQLLHHTLQTAAPITSANKRCNGGSPAQQFLTCADTAMGKVRQCGNSKDGCLRKEFASFYHFDERQQVIESNEILGDPTLKYGGGEIPSHYHDACQHEVEKGLDQRSSFRLGVAKQQKPEVLHVSSLGPRESESPPSRVATPYIKCNLADFENQLAAHQATQCFDVVENLSENKVQSFASNTYSSFYNPILADDSEIISTPNKVCMRFPPSYLISETAFYEDFDSSHCHEFCLPNLSAPFGFSNNNNSGTTVEECCCTFPYYRDSSACGSSSERCRNDNSSLQRVASQDPGENRLVASSTKLLHNNRWICRGSLDNTSDAKSNCHISTCCSSSSGISNMSLFKSQISGHETFSTACHLSSQGLPVEILSSNKSASQQLEQYISDPPNPKHTSQTLPIKPLNLHRHDNLHRHSSGIHLSQQHKRPSEDHCCHCDSTILTSQHSIVPSSQGIPSPHMPNL